MDALHQAFSDRLSGLMRDKKLSSNRLADFAGLGRSSVAAILRGEKSPTLRTLGRLAEALEVKPRDLLPE